MQMIQTLRSCEPIMLPRDVLYHSLVNQVAIIIPKCIVAVLFRSRNAAFEDQSMGYVLFLSSIAQIHKIIFPFDNLFCSRLFQISYFQKHAPKSEIVSPDQLENKPPGALVFLNLIYIIFHFFVNFSGAYAA